MKYLLGTILCCLGVLIASGQYEISGHLSLENNAEPLADATVTLKNNKSISSVSTDENGFYKFLKLKQAGEYQLLIEHIGIETKEVRVHVASTVSIVDVALTTRAYILEPLEVKSLRASDKAPFAKTNILKEEIEKSNLGQDLPFVLNQAPGVVVSSDAGNGIGYTGIRIRGSDATRINVTINGIPYNDAESQGTYFVDLPDIASSIKSIQIQRGVGTSSNGAGAFGASINLSTNELNEKAYGESNNSYGSFNSWKNTVKAGTGLLNNHFTIDTRLSRISSDGYIDRALTNLKSLYFSTAYINAKSTVRFNFLGGSEKTYQAWNGIPEDMLQTNRTYNSAGTERDGEPYNNETDNYQQAHYQLFFTHALGDKISFNTGLFLVNGKGYYEQYKATALFADYGLPDFVLGNDTLTNTDLIRQLWLDNKFYGQIFSLQYKRNKNSLTIGGAWNRYDGSHYGNIIWGAAGVPKDYHWYNLKALKYEVTGYAKWEYMLPPNFNLYADVQYRKVYHRMDGFRNNPTLFVKREFNFINPKAGVTYSHKGFQFFVSYAMANKEPNRDDFEVSAATQPKHETLHDFEAGFEKKIARYSVGATGYLMLYKNQLILTGQINDVGAYTRVNVPNSYRAGVELDGKANPCKWLKFSANISFSRNTIKNSNEYVDDYDNGGQKLIAHTNTNISFSPSIVAGLALNLIPIKNGEISFVSKYVSRQYLDNTQDLRRSLQHYFVEDVRISYTIKNKLFKELSLVGVANNIFSKEYEPNGYTFSYVYSGRTTTENYYFPMAKVNFMAGVNIKL